MSILEALILGIVQGLTEFIPVSSSGHLVIAHNILGITETGLVFDVALHIGTLIALLIFFWRDILSLIRAAFGRTRQTKLAWLIVLATIPAGLAGATLQDYAESTFRSYQLVAITLIVMALVMLTAEKVMIRRKAHTEIEDLTAKHAVMVGLAQALAIVPGISRSGSTIAIGMISGLSRTSALRFSFLLSVPTIFGAIVKVLFNQQTFYDISLNPGVFVVGILAALVSGLLAIGFLLKFLQHHGLHGFAYYRIALGITILLTVVIL